MSALKAFVAYTLVSILIASLAILSTSMQVPFGYEDDFAIASLIPHVLTLTVGVAAFCLGHALLLRRKYNAEQIAMNLVLPTNSRLIIWIFGAIQLMLLVFFFYTYLRGIGEVENFAYSFYRPMSTKLTTPALLIQSVLPLLLIRSRPLFWLSVFCCILFSILIAWLEASRSAVVPCIGIAYLAFTKGHRFLGVIVMLHALHCYAISLIARTVHSRFSVDGFFLVLDKTRENYIDIIASVISYTTAFSVLHYSYVSSNNLGNFTLSDLIYSTLPIPSFLWPAQIPDYTNWRIDIFRPMGALAEVHAISPLVMYLLLFVYGGIAKAVDTTTTRVLRVVSLIVFVFTMILLFQYNLRTLMWFLYMLIGIRILDSYLVRRTQVSLNDSNNPRY